MSEPARDLNHASVAEDLSNLQRTEMTGEVVQTDLATVNQRILAILIDGVAIAVIRTLIVSVMQAIVGHGKATVVVSIVGQLITIAYMALMEYNNGQTLGKKVMKIRVISDRGDDENLSIAQAIGRETIGRFCSAIVFFIGYLGASRRSDRKTWHDRLFQTKVVQVK